MSPKTTNNITSPLKLNFELPMGNDRRKLGNQETEDVLSWRSRILDCDAKMGNETAGYYCITFKIVAFGNILVIMNIGLQQEKELTFEL